MSEQRRAHRQHTHESVYLELITEDSQGGLLQKVISCKTMDVSSGGVRLFIDYPAEPGTIMNLCIVTGQDRDIFTLTTELRWIQPAADDGWYFAGFLIYDNELSDFDAWQAFAARFSEPSQEAPADVQKSQEPEKPQN